jgi:hypothetical protein
MDSLRRQLNGKSRIRWFVECRASLPAGLQPCSTLTISSLTDREYRREIACEQ